MKLLEPINEELEMEQMIIQKEERNTALARAESAVPLPEAQEETKPPSAVIKGYVLELRADGRLWLQRTSGDAQPVSVQRCFPWSRPLEWLSIRSEEGEEVELIENLGKLDSESAEALLKALEEAAFVFTIEALESVTEEFELRQWRVRLKEGLRSFQTKLNSWPREVPGGGLLIQDVGNDLYLIPDLERLDPASSKLLWAFMDED